MRSSVTLNMMLAAGLVAGLASGCSGSNDNSSIFTGTGGTTVQGSAGTGASAGTNGGAAGTVGGSAGTVGGSAGTVGASAGTNGGGAGTGAGGTTAGSAGTGAAGTTAAAGTGGGSSTITTVAKTAGCGMAPAAGLMAGTLVKQTIQTMGTKPAGCADSKCGDWSYARDYFVRLPAGYDNTKAYPLLIEGPGCGGKGNNLYSMADLQNSVIRVGVSPSADAQAFHATNPGQGCFDDKEGDDSVDWVLYENMWDKLASQVCFDKNRVFAGGNSSGAWFSNEVGCKYAGDATHPIRAIMPNTGGLPTDAKYVPTCTLNPMAGFWSHEVNDPTNPFTGNIVAMNRALKVNGCMPAGVTYQTATFDPFPVGGNTTSCKKYKGCPDLYPMVVCPLGGNGHGSHDDVVNPGWNAYVRLFLAAPLLTP